jgi:hypothetical protein
MKAMTTQEFPLLGDAGAGAATAIRDPSRRETFSIRRRLTDNIAIAPANSMTEEPCLSRTTSN